MTHRPVLAHDVQGSGPPVVLLNGGMMSMRAWDPVVEALRTRMTVVRCDFRGQLLSPGEPPASLDGHADDLVRLLEHLDLDAAHLVGVSFGALVALTLASAHPERVRSLVAITATERTTPEMEADGRPLALACEAAAAGGDGGAVFDLIAAGTFSPEYRQTHAAELAARRTIVASLPPAWFAAVSGLLRSLSGLDLRPRLGRIVAPTLVLGAERDLTFPVAHSRALAAGIRGARLEILPGASHGVLVEETDRVVASVLAFLQESS